MLDRMHTAEHILTAVMRRDFGSPRNVEMHLGPKKSKCDYNVDRPLGAEEIQAIEAAVNAEIAADHHVSAETIPLAEAQRRFDLWKVPEGTAEIRIVRIGDLDATPCAGEHVGQTGEVGRFRIKSHTMRADDLVRLRYTVTD
jgi:Ser-tRNA(Ala) deacylase AlaX